MQNLDQQVTESLTKVALASVAVAFGVSSELPSGPGAFAATRFRDRLYSHDQLNC